MLESVDNSETINTSSTTPDYIAEDWQAIKDSATTNNLPSKADDVETSTPDNKKR